MALATIPSAGLRGIEAYPIDVEVDIRFGLPSWTTVGLPEPSVKEGRDRVVAAIKNSGFSFEHQKITINLSPSDIRKHGTAFDLPIALGLLAASELLELPSLSDKVFIGELSLDGRLRPVPGVLPMALLAKQLGKPIFIVAPENAREASVVSGLNVAPMASLKDLVCALSGLNPWPQYDRNGPSTSGSPLELKDFSDIKGQLQARRALEVAVAGGHNILLMGPPGSGKTMLAERVPSILPPMQTSESIATSILYSIVGKLPPHEALLTERPFRAPHHSITAAGLLGGGPVPRPGEVSLAHNGVLFLDEFPEFPRHIREQLRQPLESERITIARALQSFTYPASFMLIAACNPCKCGFLGSPQKSCRCTVYEQIKYKNRLSGPLLDRIDLHIEVPALNYDELSRKQPGESSAAIRARILAARERQTERLGPQGPTCNARMGPRQVKHFCQTDAASQDLLKSAVGKFGLSARSYDRILKVARTIADLAGSDTIQSPHLAEAIQYRCLDRDEYC